MAEPKSTNAMKSDDQELVLSTFQLLLKGQSQTQNNLDSSGRARLAEPKGTILCNQTIKNSCCQYFNPSLRGNLNPKIIRTLPGELSTNSMQSDHQKLVLSAFQLLLKGQSESQNNLDSSRRAHLAESQSTNSMQPDDHKLVLSTCQLLLTGQSQSLSPKAQILCNQTIKNWCCQHVNSS